MQNKNGHKYSWVPSKEKRQEYNRRHNAKKRGIDPNIYRIRSEISPLDRLMVNSIPEPNSGCWLWLGRLDKDGYGSIVINNKLQRAHRASYFLLKGPVPDGLIVRHTCDFPPCINPDHLLVGTHLDNTCDAFRRGRRVPMRGEGHTGSKLTDDSVTAIRARFANGERQAALAAEFGVSVGATVAVIRRKTWKHVP